MSTVREIDILGRGEVDALIQACGRRSASGIRDAALLGIMAGAGLRCAEALALKVKDVDLISGKITVHRGKGCKRRVAVCEHGRLDLLRRWLTKRKALGINGNSPIFTTISDPAPGRPLDSSGVRKMFKRRAMKAGLEQRVHPHGLRHSHAVELLRAGVPVGSIKAQLGHARVSTTSIYLDRLDPAVALAPLEAWAATVRE
jgi:integrase/recombinase XerD